MEKNKTVQPKKKKINLPQGVYVDILFILINVVFILMIVFFVSSLSSKALEIKTLKNESLLTPSTETLETARARLERNKDKINTLSAMFVDDENVVEFIKEIDLLKQNGAVKDFRLISDKVVKDAKTNMDVLPFTLILEGSGEEIEAAMEKVYALPFLISDVVVEISKEGDVVKFNYGGYLYVSQQFTKN